MSKQVWNPSIFYIFFQYFRIDLENVWGHVNFYARGAGQAVAQLDVNYGVDYEPFKVSKSSIPKSLLFWTKIGLKSIFIFYFKDKVHFLPKK